MQGQQPDTMISGKFSNMPFEDFVKEVEKTTAFVFYFRPEWVKDIGVTFSDSGRRLSGILTSVLEPAGFNFYTENHTIYIYPGKSLITELPVYTHHLQTITATTTYKDSITGIERKYLDGKIIASVPVITVGNRQKTVSGSSCIITGKILEEATGEPLIGATVYVEDLKMGIVTDIDGHFRLAVVPGKYKVLFNYMSMKQLEYYLQVYSSGDITIEMKKTLVEIDEARITANLYDNVKGMQMGYERIAIKSIKEIPVILGERDILKVAQMLPGVQNVGEGSSGINVRGSSTDENMFYINKIPVYNTSHLFGFFSAFSPDIINNFTLYKSNIPARYGGRLASIFDITTRQGSKKKFFGKGGISPVTAHCSFEVPVIKDKVSLVTSWRSSYSDWILKKIKDRDIRKSSAFFYDVSLGIHAELNERNMLKLFGYGSSDKFSLSSINDYAYSNTGASAIWKHIFSSSVASEFSLIYSRYIFENTDKTNASEAFTHDYSIEQYEADAGFSYLTRFNHRFDFGGSLIYYNLDRGSILPYGGESLRIPAELGKEQGLEGAFYISDEFALYPDLSLQAGLRYSYYGQLGPAVTYKYYPEDIRNINNITEKQVYHAGDLVKLYSGPEYRIALNYLIGNTNSLKASYNRMYQYIYMLSNTIAVSPDDQWKLCDSHIPPALADQLSLGYYHNFRNTGIKASLEVYQKWISNKVQYKDGTEFLSVDPIETQVLQGKQHANGIELMIHKNAGKISGWASYCFSRSLMKVDGVKKENQINNGMIYPSNYDRPHSLNLVMNYRTNRRLSLSANFIYTTGRPITYPISVYYSEGQQLLHFSERNEYRIPDYIRLDLSANLEGNLIKKKPLHSFWMVSLYNVLGRKNAYSVYYAAERGKVKGYKLSIFALPIFTISWNYKFGNYLNE